MTLRALLTFTLCAYACDSTRVAGPGARVLYQEANLIRAALDTVTLTASWQSQCDSYDLGDRLRPFTNCMSDPFSIEVTCSLAGCEPQIARTDGGRGATVQVLLPQTDQTQQATIRVLMRRDGSTEFHEQSYDIAVVPVIRHEVFCGNSTTSSVWIAGRSTTPCQDLWRAELRYLHDDDQFTYPIFRVMLVGVGPNDELVPVSSRFAFFNARGAPTETPRFDAGMGCPGPNVTGEGSAPTRPRFPCAFVREPGRLVVEHGSFHSELSFGNE